MTDPVSDPHSLNPELTVKEAGPVLEQLLHQRTGSSEFERLYRTITRQAKALTTDEATLIEGIVTLGFPNHRSHQLRARHRLAREHPDP